MSANIATTLEEHQVRATVAQPHWIRRFLGACPPLVVFAILWMVVMVTVALSANMLAPYGFSQLDLSARLLPPSFMGGAPEHWLGTDELGRDVLSRLMVSIRISLLVAFIGTLLSATLGVLLGFWPPIFAAG